jgi:hypothetical protein
MKEKRKYTQKILEEIYDLLPPKPFPLHIHKKIAKKLGYSNSYVYMAIQEQMLDDYKVVELREIAKERKLKSFSQLRKQNLINLIRIEIKSNIVL